MIVIRRDAEICLAHGVHEEMTSNLLPLWEFEANNRIKLLLHNEEQIEFHGFDDFREPKSPTDPDCLSWPRPGGEPTLLSLTRVYTGRYKII